MHQPGPEDYVTALQIPNKMQRWVSESDQFFPFYAHLCLIRSSCLSKNWLTNDLSPGRPVACLHSPLRKAMDKERPSGPNGFGFQLLLPAGPKPLF